MQILCEQDSETIQMKVTLLPQDTHQFLFFFWVKSITWWNEAFCKQDEVTKGEKKSNHFAIQEADDDYPVQGGVVLLSSHSPGLYVLLQKTRNHF